MEMKRHDTKMQKVHVMVFFLSLVVNIVQSQVTCSRAVSREWHTQPKNITMSLNLTDHTCTSSTQCWNTHRETSKQWWTSGPYHYPQLCPLDLQLGDVMVVLIDRVLEQVGVHLVNVSKEEFDKCLIERPKEEQIAGKYLSRTSRMDPKWLRPGINYFAVSHGDSSELCRLGLRIALLVKDQRCKSSPLLRLCSGNGDCRSAFQDEVYRCHCHKFYSGQYCENFDGCYEQPCWNGGTCLSKRTAFSDEPPYECLCPPSFTGVNCSEFSAEQKCGQSCKKGVCVPASSATYTCECFPQYTGAFCDGERLHCDSNPCRNDGLCEETANGYVCSCPGGFTGLNCETTTEVDSFCRSNGCQLDQTCDTDKPECVENAEVCGPFKCLNGGICVTLNGQFYCKCRQGFSGRNCEEKTDFCVMLSANCLNEGLCLNLASGYHCLCAPGWTGEACQHLANACLAFSNRCLNGATCISMSQSSRPPHYTCTCLTGYTGLHCEAEVNECDSSPCQHKGTCTDFVGYYTCTCPSGFTGEHCEVDVDACDLPGITCPPRTLCVDLPSEALHTCQTSCPPNFQPCANGGHCVLNSITSYRCVCAPGWTGPTCSVNMNKCGEQRCQNGATCVDAVGGYRCICSHGYTGLHCEQDINFCSGHHCSQHGVCVDRQHDYTCQCMLGYQGPVCEVETDECSSSPCANSGTCIDLVASYQCLCAPGFKGRRCWENMNECRSGPCFNGGTCIDLTSDFICICPVGFTGHDCSTPSEGPDKDTSMCEEPGGSSKCSCRQGYTGRFCESPISHCTEGLCQHGSKCVDLPMGFVCECLPGLTGRFCEGNIDNCLDKPCGALSICKDAINSYQCFCAPGFVGKNCEIEVNECLSQPCRHGASCLDELNSFSCVCVAGTTGSLCEINIDECHSSPCWNGGTCVDLLDGYKCLCASGFSGLECSEDVDECASVPCKNGGTCIDQPGNYYCRCVAPFKGADCEFLPCEDGNPCENGAKCLEEEDLSLFPLGFWCQCQRGFAGPRCEVNVDECVSNPCVHGFCYDVVDGFYCLCNPGFAGIRCEQDINDCASNACENNSTCVDLHLSYSCVCRPGWEGEFCQHETDECSPNPCKNNATCVDLLNAYSCMCPTGWTGRNCEDDVKECESSPCQNGGQCIESNIPGEFSCTCPAFFIGPLCDWPYNPCGPQHNPCLHDSTCRAQSDGTALCVCPVGFEGTLCEIDSDDCVSRPCQNRGHCVDGVNSYSCFCTPGFSGRQCEEDINECESNPCQNRGVCQDLVSSFQCTCMPGFHGRLCHLDLNECESSPCFHNGVCVNKHGGFVCVCPAGFSGAWCEVNVDECKSNPCRNSGRCIDADNGYQCVCSRGFMGDHCERDVDECSSSPCVHGSCLDKVDSYDCQCEAGWTGKRCEINIDDCESHPCLNGGSCVDLLDKYACICTDGFSGKICDIDESVCLQSSLNFSRCFNGGVCVDGPGANFTCSCPPGFVGDFCEVEMNECCSEPCLHGAICQDLINGYHCHCRPGWTGLHCEDDINECLLQPCNQGMCIQNEPGHGYTCFCRPGFVGKHCEYNYDDCLIRPCPDGFSCKDSINNVSCVSVEPSLPSSEVTPRTIPESPMDNVLDLTGDITYGRYSGNSFVEFDGIEPSTAFNVTVRFQTKSGNGTLLYSDQGPGRDAFFIKLFVSNGTLQYDFSCNQKDAAQRINTAQQVADGNEYVVILRQLLAPCRAEVIMVGFGTTRSVPTNHSSAGNAQRTQGLFIGGLPQRHPPHKEAEPVHNYTGCIEVMGINKFRRLKLDQAIARNNVTDCRSPGYHDHPAHSTTSPPRFIGSVPSSPSPVCQQDVCLNGGACQSVSLPSGASSFFCDCPLYFTGRLCEKETAISYPGFSGRSFLELPSLTSLFQSDAHFESLPPGDRKTVFLTMKSKTPHGTIFFTQEQNFGDHFLHVFLQNGRPVAKLGCNGLNVLTVSARQTIKNDTLVPLTVIYALPSRDNDLLCLIEISVSNGTANRQLKYMSEDVSEVVFGSTFLGGVPSRAELQHGGEHVSGFTGCIYDLQMGSRELNVMKETIRGQNIENCDSTFCQHKPCRHGGTCVSQWKSWLCECPPLFSGTLCQFSACERNPCAPGATCVPQTPLEAACLCPFGRQGLLCHQDLSITRPSFSGLDEFGYSSYVAYSSIPNMDHFYEFQLKLTFANNASAFKNNLILFSGQKGQGISGDDFFLLGVRNRRIVHKYNLGSGVTAITSEPLNPRIKIHTVHFGRHLKNGWLKVDGGKQRTATSPGPLVGLNTFSLLYVGGYEEHTPELLPEGSRFQNGFQGCIFDLLFRTRPDGKLRAPGWPEGRPASGRNVGQCGVNPCGLVRCRNGGTCVDAGSSVHCQCVFGWKGALCSEKVSFCDAEHTPPPSCAGGATCVPLPDGYTCQCPLGSAGPFCQQALSITDPSFFGNLSSWMAFPAVNLRHRTHLKLQFQSLSAEGILFYTAQYLSTHSGDFLSISLSNAFVQLRYNLGNETIILQSVNKVDVAGKRWHTVITGREGNQGFLVLDDQAVSGNLSEGTNTLDVSGHIYIGGVSSLSALSPEAVEKEAVGFSGGIREVLVNGQELELTEKGALAGANVADWDGTGCGYKVCQNGGYCQSSGDSLVMCVCPSLWTGPRCQHSIYCVNNQCQHGSLCAHDVKSASYWCVCPLGWVGRFCQQNATLQILKFVGSSYLKFNDPRYNSRNLTMTEVSMNFSASAPDGLILWMGKGDSEDDDHLAIGLQDGHLKVSVNLGGRLALPLFYRSKFCCEEWNHLSITLNRTLIQVHVNKQRVIFEDLDPFEQYIALNYKGVSYLGGFDLDREVTAVTSGVFTMGFVGRIQDFLLYQDTKQHEVLQASEGFNVHQGE